VDQVSSPFQFVKEIIMERITGKNQKTARTAVAGRR
jgi:hypothetical protein